MRTLSLLTLVLLVLFVPKLRAQEWQVGFHWAVNLPGNLTYFVEEVEGSVLDEELEPSTSAFGFGATIGGFVSEKLIIDVKSGFYLFGDEGSADGGVIPLSAGIDYFLFDVAFMEFYGSVNAGYYHLVGDFRSKLEGSESGFAVSPGLGLQIPLGFRALKLDAGYDYHRILGSDSFSSVRVGLVLDIGERKKVRIKR